MRHNSTANDSPLGDNARISTTMNANKQKLDEGLELRGFKELIADSWIFIFWRKEVVSILSIGFIILFFLVTLANESHCGLLIGTLLGVVIVSSIGARIAFESNGPRKRVPKKPPNKNAQV